MSDINTMNDFGEVHWTYDKFIEAANQVLGDVSRGFIDKLDLTVSCSQLYTLPMLCSLSTDGDVLSQWRAYAEDGSGVAIGFDASNLSTLSVRTGRICYSEAEQREYFATLLRAMHEIYYDLPERKKSDFLMEEGTIFAYNMALFKNPGFAEEKEVRLIRAVNVAQNKGQWSLSDIGGSGEDVSAEPLKISYRANTNGALIAYVKLPLEGLGSELIREGILGPKNPCNGNELSMALNAFGHNNTKILKSRSTYR